TPPMPCTTRREPKPEPFWRDLIDRWKAFGKTVAVFCAAHRVGQASFYAWRQRLAAPAPAPAAPAPPAPAFAAVRIAPGPPAEVVLPNGLVVRVPVGAAPAAVARLVALGGEPC